MTWQIAFWMAIATMICQLIIWLIIVLPAIYGAKIKVDYYDKEGNRIGCALYPRSTDTNAICSSATMAVSNVPIEKVVVHFHNKDQDTTWVYERL